MMSGHASRVLPGPVSPPPLLLFTYFLEEPVAAYLREASRAKREQIDELGDETFN